MLYYSRNAMRPELAGLYVARIGGGEPKFLGRTSSSAVFAEPGYLLFRRDAYLMAQAFDVGGWRDSNYKGYAIWTTSSFFYFGPAYNHEVTGYPYDPEAAEELLADAGWYDRDGNGVVDKDGQDLVVEALMPSGNKASETMLQAIQDAYAKVGVRLDIQFRDPDPRRFSAYLDREIPDIGAIEGSSELSDADGSLGIDHFELHAGRPAQGRVVLAAGAGHGERQARHVRRVGRWPRRLCRRTDR